MKMAHVFGKASFFAGIDYIWGMNMNYIRNILFFFSFCWCKVHLPRREEGPKCHLMKSDFSLYVLLRYLYLIFEMKTSMI